jgi:N-acetylmuramate 1-kinase
MNQKSEIVAFAQKALGLAQSAETELIPFEGRGSDRTYYRFRWSDSHSAILVHYQPTRVENTYYAGIAHFLDGIGVSVPRILRHDPQGCFILMKDLGDVDLWFLRNESWELRRALYQKTLVLVSRLHSFSQQHFPAGEVKLTEAFGPELYRWERNYFEENFVQAFCGIELDPSYGMQLEAELAGLAERLDTGRRSLVHRDLQSQNVMIENGEPFLIDFQGMRFGTRFYDLGSLLCDPYVNLSSAERTDLLSYYHRVSKDELDWEDFQKAFWEASAQRLMQALGAYGYLGITRGLTNYIAHIPSGLQNLQAAAEKAASLPLLHALSIQCGKCIQINAGRSLDRSTPATENL